MSARKARLMLSSSLSPNYISSSKIGGYQIPGYHGMGQLLEHRPCIGTHWRISSTTDKIFLPHEMCENVQLIMLFCQCGDMIMSCMQSTTLHRQPLLVVCHLVKAMKVCYLKSVGHTHLLAIIRRDQYKKCNYSKFIFDLKFPLLNHWYLLAIQDCALCQKNRSSLLLTQFLQTITQGIQQHGPHHSRNCTMLRISRIE